VPKLNVNIDHVATLRQQRLGLYPSVLEAAKEVERAGADGITVHLREDRRHIQDRDVFGLKKILKTKLNLEMAAAPEIVSIALKVKPAWATLVPEKRAELTTEGGLDVVKNQKVLGRTAEKLHKAGIEVSFFVDPDPKQVRASRILGADYVEIHTGVYADASSAKETEKEFSKIAFAAGLASSLGLRLNAGHGLNYENMKRMRKIKEIEEFSIGHSIISRAVFTGLYTAVREMLALTK